MFNIKKKLFFLTGILAISLLWGCSQEETADADKKVKEESEKEVSDKEASDKDSQDNTSVYNAEDENSGEALSGERPVFVAHRGYSTIAPDNSMSSFQAAADFGADMIELDVQMSKDGYIMVYHDFSMEPLGGDKKEVIADFTYEELRNMSIGNRFEEKNGTLSDCTYVGYANEKMPTLNDVMRLAKDNNIGVNIEIKSISDVAEYTDEEISWFIDEIIRIVEENDMADATIISSFNYNYIKEIEEKYPKYETYFLTNILNMEAFEGDFVGDGIAIYYGCLQDDTIERMHNIGKKVYIWTVDNYAMMKKITAMGVDGIISDDVGLMDYFK